jgi:hypothetical protein
MRRVATFALSATALALAGCGGSPGDLLAIDVSGGAAQRHQRIVVENNGNATCNGGPTRDIGSDALIDAREIERELKDPADAAAVFGPGRRGATSYVARTKDGAVRWQEGAPGLPAVLPKAQLFALQQGRTLCAGGGSGNG